MVEKGEYPSNTHGKENNLAQDIDASNWHVIDSNFGSDTSDLFESFAQVLSDQDEEVIIRNEIGDRGNKIQRLVASPQVSAELKIITTLMEAHPAYEDLRSRLWKSDSSTEAGIDAPSIDEQKSTIEKVYSEIVSQAGGRDYFRSLPEESEVPYLFPLRMSKKNYPIRIVADLLRQRGYDLKEFEFKGNVQDQVYILAKGEDLKAFSKVINTDEIRGLDMAYWRPIWMGEGMAGMEDSSILQNLLRTAELSENDLRAAEALLHVDNIERNPGVDSVIERAESELERIGIKDPLSVLQAKISEIIERELAFVDEVSDNPDFSLRQYTKSDFETGLIHSRMRKIIKEIVTMYGFGEEDLGGEPYLEFVDYDTYRYRTWSISVDGYLAPMVRVPSSSYFSPKGEAYFKQPEDRSIVSILFQNMGDHTMVEEVLHWIHSRSVNLEDFEKTKSSSFFHGINSEALAYLTCKNIFPIADLVTSEGQIYGMPEGFSYEDLQKFVLAAGVNLEEELARLNESDTIEEWFDKHLFKTLTGIFPGPIIHGIGYFLGDIVYEKMRKGEVTPSKIRDTFFAPGDPIEHYKKLITMARD